MRGIGFGNWLLIVLLCLTCISSFTSACESQKRGKAESDLQVCQAEVAQLKRTSESDVRALTGCRDDLKSSNEMFKQCDGVAVSCIRERRSCADSLDACEAVAKKAMRR